MKGRATLLVLVWAFSALVAIPNWVASSELHSVEVRATKFHYAPFCCKKCSDPGCCCPAQGKLPATHTVWAKTSTTTVRKTVQPGLVRGRSQISSPPSSDALELTSEPITGIYGPLFSRDAVAAEDARHNCPVCPKGAVISAWSGKTNSGAKYCCRPRKTITKTRKGTWVKTVTQTVTGAAKATIRGRAFYDNDKNNIYSKPPDAAIVNTPILLVLPGNQRATVSVLCSTTTDKDGKFTCLTDPHPNKVISVVLEAKPNVPVSSVKTDLNGNAEKEIPIIRPAKPTVLTLTVIDNIATVTGKGVPGSKITILLSNGARGTAIVKADGTFVVKSNFVFSGSYPVTITQSTPTGATSEPVSAGTATILQPPIVGTPQVSAGKVTVSGTAEPNANVTIYSDGIPVGSVKADAKGEYTVTSSKLGGGTHAITITQRNVHGVSDPAKAGSVSIEGPVLTVKNNIGTVTGKGTPGSTIKIYVKGVYHGSTTVKNDGTYSIDSLFLTSGTWPVEVTETLSGGGAEGEKVLVGPAIIPAKPGVTTPVVNGKVVSIIKGTGIPGVKVTIYSDGLPVGTATVGANGHYTVATSPLGGGKHVITVTQTDSKGVSDPAPAGSVTIAGPTLSVIDNIATVSGQGTPGATIKLYIANTFHGTTVVKPDGSYSISSTFLHSGTYSVDITETPSGGSEGAKNFVGPAPIPLVPGTSAPSIVGKVVTVKGTALPGTTIAIYSDGVAVGTAITDAAGQYEVATSALAGGTRNVTITQRNKEGVSDPAKLSVTISGPVLTVANNIATVTGKATPGSTIKIYVNGTYHGSTVVSPNGTYSVPSLFLTSGSWPVEVTETPSGGSEGPKTYVGPAPIPPKPTTTAPTVVGKVVTVTGTALAGSTVTIYSDGVAVGTAVADATGQYSVSSSALSGGQPNITLTQTDSNGISDIAIAGSVNISGPSLTVVDNIGTVKGNSTPGATIRVYVDGVGGATVVVAPDGTYSLNTTYLTSGTYNVTITETPSGGSEGPQITVGPAVILQPPVVTGSASVSGSTVSVSGTATTGATIVIYSDGVAVGTVTAGAGGAYTITSSALAAGSHNITLTQRDVHGISDLALAGSITIGAAGTTTVVAAGTTTHVPTRSTTSHTASSTTLIRSSTTIAPTGQSVFQVNGSFVVADTLVLANASRFTASFSNLLTEGDGLRILRANFPPTAVYTPGGIKAPKNWTIEYSTDNGTTWVTTEPANAASVTNVRAKETIVGAGRWLSDTQQLYPAKAKAPVPNSNLEASGGGDVFSLVVSDSRVYGVWHHEEFLAVECWDKESGKKCKGFDPATLTTNTSATSKSRFTGYKTYFKVESVVIGTELWTIAVDSSSDKPGMVCVDVSVGPPKLCTTPFVELSTTVLTTSGSGHSTDQWSMAAAARIGDRFFVQTIQTQELLCFDMTSKAKCTSSPTTISSDLSGVSGGDYSAVFTNSFLVAAGTNIWLSSNTKLYCVVAATLATCDGTYPLDFGSSGLAWSALTFSPMAYLNTTGAVLGICTISGCIDTHGTVQGSWVNPFDTIAPVCNPCASGFQFPERGGHFTVLESLKKAIITYPYASADGTDGINPSPVGCWDYATQSICTDAGSSSVVAGAFYQFSPDPSNPTCLFFTSDIGSSGAAIVGMYDIITGAQDCTSSPVITITAGMYDPETVCSTGSPVQTWDSFIVKSLTGGGSYGQMLLTVKTSSGTTTSIVNQPLTLNTALDLKPYTVELIGTTPTFVLTFTTVTGNITGADFELRSENRGPEICITFDLDVDKAPASEQPCPIVTIEGQLDEMMTAPTASTVNTRLPPKSFRGSGNAGTCPPLATVATAPSAPLSLAKANAGTANVTVTFDKPTSDGGIAIQYYEINTGTGYRSIVVSEGAPGSYTGYVTGPVASVSVRAVNLVGFGTAATV